MIATLKSSPYPTHRWDDESLRASVRQRTGAQLVLSRYVLRLAPGRYRDARYWDADYISLSAFLAEDGVLAERHARVLAGMPGCVEASVERSERVQLHAVFARVSYPRWLLQ